MEPMERNLTPVTRSTVNAFRLDAFRLTAAFLVVAIHTSPLTDISRELDFMTVHVAARIAVPFFFMASGFFLLPAWKMGETGSVKRFFGRTGLMYIAAVLLYLPVNLYAGQLTGGRLLQKLLFDGTFYHLWYLPAALLGMGLVLILCRKRPLQKALPVAAILYALGLLGDSWYGLAEEIPLLCKLFDAIFTVSSYTRNGLFFAPLFLILGGMLGEAGGRRGVTAVKERRITAPIARFPFREQSLSAVFFLLLLLEGSMVHRLSLARHDSMYAALPFFMWFFFSSLAKPAAGNSAVLSSAAGKNSAAGKGLPVLRTLSAWIYILHPMMILLVRGFAKTVGLERLLVENSLIHYGAVCLLSLLSAYGAACVERAGRSGRKRWRKRKRMRKTDRAWIELDLQALRENVRLLSARVPDGCRLMPAVKAEAYGHGAVYVARELNRMGIRSFCVAEAEEGVKLRQKGVRGEILVLGYTHPSQLGRLKRYRLTQTAVDCDYARLLSRYSVRRGKILPGRLKVHIKVDTGMRRLGEDASHVEKLAALWEYPGLKITGIYTHLCAADSGKREDVAFTKEQIGRFDRLIQKLKERGIDCPPCHIQNSCGILNDALQDSFQNEKYRYARPGIALYGLMSGKQDYKLCKLNRLKPDASDCSEISSSSGPALAPVLSLYARIETVKLLKKGETAGYARAYTAPEDKRIAVLSIGYADGIPGNIASGGAYVLIGGKKAPVIGRICMDQMLVDVSGAQEASQGGVAVLIGSCAAQSGETARITAEDMAGWAGIITNELVSRLGGRLRRILLQ